MIDIKNERLLTFGQAAKLLPYRRMGRPVSTCTIWRWTRLGKAGVRLEAVRLPGGYATTAEAIQRFVDRLTERLDRSLPPNEVSNSRATNPQVEADLDRAGIGPTTRTPGGAKNHRAFSTRK
jgi:hypothetical protein